MSNVGISQNDQLSHCDKLLEHGIRDNYQVQSLSLFRSYLRELFNYSQSELQEYVKNGSGKLSVPIPVADAFLKAELSSNSNKKYFSELRSKYSSDLTLELTDQEFESITSSVINKDALDAWNKCIEDIGSKQNKIVYTVFGRDNEVFGITFRYVPNEEDDPEIIKVTTINVAGGGVKHIPTRIQDGSEIRRYSGYTQLFRRTELDKDITIKLDFEGRDGITISIPGLKPQDIIPVGTIVSSILPWPVFASTVNNDSNYNPSTNSWAPCDSRSIRGSELARLGGGSNTPDLRGVFLRGLNTFSTDEPSPVTDIQRDPTLNRKAGDFQNDDFKSHNHRVVTIQGNGAWNRGAGADGDGSGELDTGDTGGSETRPKNVAVFYYIKIN